MTSAFQEVIDVLEMQQRQVRDAISHSLSFDSEGPTKLRKLARLEGEFTGLETALGIIKAVGSSESARVA
jgi:hypothetical protein